MTKYISTDALIEELKRRDFMPVIVKQAIDAVPATDVVEVVRCEECIRRGTEDCAMYYGCECGEHNAWETDNDFCSWGERRNNETY